jgi:FkbH-like protein
VTASLLDRIDEAIALGAPALALALLRQHYATRPTLSTASGVIERVGRLGRAAGLAPCKLFVLRSFTVEPVVPLLRAQAMLHGIDLEVAVGEFNAYPQEVLDPGSALHAFAPDVVLFALQTRDLVPALWSGGGPEAGAAVDRALGDLGAWVERLRAGSRAQILALSFCPPVWSSAGLLDAQAADGQAALIGRLNHGLRGIAAAVPGTTVVDYEGLVARHGRQRWHDERKWLTARMPIAADCLAPFADELVRALVALRGKTRKAMVVDLDNTLWGGVVGEDGPQGIALGAEYPGAAFQALQRALKDLVDRGILLAIASKNNEADAREVLSDHPGMVLRPTDFAATRINWNDKAGSLRELAAELNIGLDSLVFLDDNPVERERVRAEVPEVAVLDLPEDPMQFAAVVRGCLWFDRATLTDEDRARTRQYAQQRERAALESSAGSVEEFLASLEMSMIAARPSAQTVARVAQLTQKTNQFNTTTRRRTDEEVRALVEAPGSEVWQYAVRDRFGDNGIVGVGILSVDGTRAELDTFLMSCRVIGRTVETAMLSHLAARARDRGAGELRGWFHPTRKNAPAAGFFAGHGFREAERAGDSVCWALELAAAPAVPRWISLVTEGN